MFGLLIMMFFLGAFQLIWAIIHPIVTKYKSVRKHFGYYWIGVFAYFSILTILLNSFSRLESNHFFHAFFFLGAFGLAAYHFGIIGTYGWHNKEVEAELKKNSENKPEPFSA
jgi:hypothetical protein